MKDSEFESWLDEGRGVIQLAHKGRDGSVVFLDLDSESAGTRRLLMLLGGVFSALDQGAPLLVDELDASLHTQACEAVLRLFCSPETNPLGAQIIATTHDTNLLRSPVLRRDQIWFTEKDAEGATHLYPLTDIRTRKGDNFEKGYLQGRYGAIPFAGQIPDLVATG
jgi:AAA15 family ATPase/GTPase